MSRGLGSGRLYKVHSGNGVFSWCLDWKGSDGKRHRQLLSQDRRVAERLRNDIIQKRDLALGGLGSIEGQSRPLTELRALYLADLHLRTSVQHHRNVTAKLEFMLQRLPARRVRDLLPHMVLELRTQRIKDGASHRTINIEVANMQAMLRWGERVGLIAANPIERIPRLPLTKGHLRHQRRAMTDDEIERFLEAARVDDEMWGNHAAAKTTIENGTKGRGWCARPRAPRIPQAPMWRAFLECGARYGELTRSTWGDVDFTARMLTLRGENTKTGKTRSIPLREGLVRVLEALRPIHETVLERPLLHTDRVFLTPEGAVWTHDGSGARRIFDRLLELAKIPRKDAAGYVLDIHALRHTFATRLARAGVGLLQAQRLLGHADPNMTARVYTHLDVDDLRDAIARLDDGAWAGRKHRLRAV